MSTWGIVVTAGSGSRFGRPKHSVELRGKLLWVWAQDALLAGGVENVIIVGASPTGIPGGERRRDSVAAGLAEIPDDEGHVLVHDAARPLASPALVGRVLSRLAEGPDGVVPMVPVRDTLKRASGGRVIETVDRNGLFAGQTPQGFRLSTLRRAHESTDESATDDAVLVERIGGVVLSVDGEATNLKITFPEDLAVAEAMVR